MVFSGVETRSQAKVVEDISGARSACHVDDKVFTDVQGDGSTGGLVRRRVEQPSDTRLHQQEKSKHNRPTSSDGDYMYQATFSKSLFLANNLVIFKGSNSLTSIPRGPETPADD